MEDLRNPSLDAIKISLGLGKMKNQETLSWCDEGPLLSNSCCLKDLLRHGDSLQDRKAIGQHLLLPWKHQEQHLLLQIGWQEGALLLLQWWTPRAALLLPRGCQKGASFLHQGDAKRGCTSSSKGMPRGSSKGTARGGQHLAMGWLTRMGHGEERRGPYICSIAHVIRLVRWL